LDRRGRLRALFGAYYNGVEATLLFLERIPAAPLANYIRALWYAKAGDVPHHRERILPSGCVQIILSLSRDFILDSLEGSAECCVKPALVVGARSVYEIVDSSDMADLVGIVFEPGGFPIFASDAADRFSNRSVALECIWGRDAEDLRDRLREMESPERRLECMERYLHGRFRDTAGEFCAAVLCGVTECGECARDSAADRVERAQIFAGISRGGRAGSEGVVPSAAVPESGETAACGY
jgi:hypothetical protein